jgi:hypothetical protein
VSGARPLRPFGRPDKSSSSYSILAADAAAFPGKVFPAESVDRFFIIGLVEIVPDKLLLEARMDFAAGDPMDIQKVPG